MLKFWKSGDVNKNERVEEKLYRWLLEEGFTVEKVLDTNSIFRYFATKNGPPKFSIFQSRSKSDCIIVESGVAYNREDEILSRSFQNQTLILEIISNLLCKGFIYKIQPPQLQADKAGGIVFAKPIYYDGLSKDRFVETTSQTINMAIFIIVTLQRHATASTNSVTTPNKIQYLT
ncbi:DUF2299 family protein [Candidatus Bathyarchaeota archaeon]|nr:DUF2299 family protein [Candidatus Bathyarchaeota archaeon]